MQGPWFPGWSCALPPVVGADSISARRTLRRRKVPGTMQASSPTWVCNYARAAVSRLAAGLAMDRRGGFHIRPRNPRAAARSGGMGHPALRPPGWPPPFGLAQNIKFIRRGGIHPARGTPRRHRGPGRCKHRPLHGFAIMQGPWFPGWSCALPPVVGADSISARRTLRRRKVPGTMQASSPTWVCNYARAAVSRFAAGLAMDRRGGFHIRPRDLAPPQGPAG